jgi:hypothetical protein
VRTNGNSIGIPQQDTGERVVYSPAGVQLRNRVAPQDVPEDLSRFMPSAMGSNSRKAQVKNPERPARNSLGGVLDVGECPHAFCFSPLKTPAQGGPCCPLNLAGPF